MGGEAHPIPNPSSNITTASSGTGGVSGSPSAAAVVGGSPLSASAAKVKVKALALAVMKEDAVVGMEAESEAEAEAETESLTLTPTPTPMPALKKGPWTSAEDAILVEYVKKHGEGNWNAVQKYSGLYRCGKSCRLRWANHLRPNLKKGAFTAEEERLILELHAKLGNKWARMAAQLPGRTDNEIKNYWNTRIKRRQRAGLPLYPPDIQQQLHSSSSSASPSAAHVHHQQRPHTHTQVNVAADIFSSSSVSVSAASASSLSFKADGSGGVGVGLSPRVTFESLNSCPAPLLPPSMCNVASMAVGGSLSLPLPVPVPLPLHATTYGTSTGGGMKALCDSNFLKPLQASVSASPSPSPSPSLPYSLQETFSSAATATPPMVGLSPPPDFMVSAHLPLPLALQEDFMNSAKPFTGLVKMELPSIQVAESVHHMPGSSMSMSMSVITGNNPHARANANPNPDVNVDHLGLLSNNNNSGLLESLLQEAHFMAAGNTTTVKIPAMSCSPASSSSEFQGASSCSSSNHTDNVISSLQSKVSGNFRASDPLASLEGHPSFSILNDHTAVPTMGTRTSLVDDITTSHSGIERKVKVEEATEEYMSSASCDDEHFSAIMGFGRQESFPDTDWYNQNSEMAKEQSVVSENIASLLNDDLGTTVQLPVTTTSDHSWGLCSCPWSNLPGVC